MYTSIMDKQNLPTEFREFVLLGYTVRRIRQELSNLGKDVSAFTDCELIIYMREILHAEVHSC